LFISIQRSIEEQFEFLQARWINDEARPKSPSGNDMIVGQNQTPRDGVRRAVLFGEGLQIAQVQAPRQFVIPTGGGYFFVPSLPALRRVIVPEQRNQIVASAVVKPSAKSGGEGGKKKPRPSSGRPKAK
jgi:hypothetical protein